MADAAQKLVEGRECGACTSCCIHLLINSKEFVKLPGVVCPNCEKGCRIYETRPSLCRDYYCGWRTMPELPDSWRPDKIGVIVNVVQNVACGREIHFNLTGAKFVLHDRNFAIAVARLVAQNQPTFLVFPGKGDEAATKVFLNAGMRVAVMSHDLAQVTQGLLLAYESGMRHPRQKLNLGAPAGGFQ